LTFKQLRYFCIIANSESFSKAAESLGVSQPAISRTMADLEKELETVLLDRTSTGPRLTASGQILYDTAIHILNHEQVIYSRIKELKEDRKKVLQIGLSQSLNESPIFPLISSYEAVSNDIQVSFVEKIPTKDALKLLQEGVISLFLADSLDLEKNNELIRWSTVLFIYEMLYKIGFNSCIQSEKRINDVGSSELVLISEAAYSEALIKKIKETSLKNTASEVKIVDPQWMIIPLVHKNKCQAILPRSLLNSTVSDTPFDFKQEYLSHSLQLICSPTTNQLIEISYFINKLLSINIDGLMISKTQLHNGIL
jgi:hypothetical protein